MTSKTQKGKAVKRSSNRLSSSFFYLEIYVVRLPKPREGSQDSQSPAY